MAYDSDTNAKPPTPGFMHRIRTYFLTGVIVAGPVAVTLVADLVVRHLGRQSGAAASFRSITGPKPICR